MGMKIHSDINHLQMKVFFNRLSSMTCSGRLLTLGGSAVLTGTWLDRGNPLPGLFFLLLLLLLAPPPPLMVLPPEILRFRRLLGACLDGSAADTNKHTSHTNAGLRGAGFLCGLSLPGGATILCHFWKRQVLRQSLGLRL